MGGGESEKKLHPRGVCVKSLITGGGGTEKLNCTVGLSLAYTFFRLCKSTAKQRRIVVVMHFCYMETTEILF